VLTADLGFGRGNGFHVEAERSRWGWTVCSENVEAIYLSTTGQYRAVTLNPGVFAFCRGSICHYDVVHFYGLIQFAGAGGELLLQAAICTVCD
jgi:hypothetical protein